MSDFLNELWANHQNSECTVPPEHVKVFVDQLFEVLFPSYSSTKFENKEDFVSFFNKTKEQLTLLLEEVPCEEHLDKIHILKAFYEELPHIRKQLLEDAQAMFDGDPAAESEKEVIRTYPGFYAIAAYRIAHFLDNINVPQLPRMISEYAHSRTGVEIHPHATIGKGFSIDHGTGVVIGATAEIGDFVKLYQGVTLGALSVTKELAGVKRHPSIGDHVIIYAGATILGGNTTIGSNSIIGGNVWITKSVPEGSKIYYKVPKPEKSTAVNSAKV